MGVKSFCKSWQNMLRKFTIPTKLLQPLMVVGDFNPYIASHLLCSGLTHTLFSWIKMVWPMYCSIFLNSWHFFGDVLRPFLSNAFNKSSSFVMWDCFEGVNSNKSSIIASQYVLLSRQLRMVFLYICQIGGRHLVPLAFSGINMKHFPSMAR